MLKTLFYQWETLILTKNEGSSICQKGCGSCQNKILFYSLLPFPKFPCYYSYDNSFKSGLSFYIAKKVQLSINVKWYFMN